MRASKAINTNLSDKIMMFIIYSFLSIITLIVLIPILYTFSVSLTPYAETLKRGGIILYPTKITLEYYAFIFRGNSPLTNSFFISTVVTVGGTLFSLVITAMTAYPLSKKYLPYKGIIMSFFFFTMLFSGGMIPTYLVVKSLKLVNSLWALIIPSAMAVYYMIILKSFFSSIPESLEEAAKIDGANDLYVLWKIVIPLSKPALASISLFYAVGNWNMFFDAMIYINDPLKKTLQIVLRETLLLSQVTDFAILDETQHMPPIFSLQMAITVVAILPMMILYPVLQKYFVKGIMIGAVKG